MKNTYQKISVIIATASSIIAGILHSTVVAFEHVATLPLETIFFIAGGVAQIVLAARNMSKHSVHFFH